METLQDTVAQELIEKSYSRKHIDAKIRKSMDANDWVQAKILEGVSYIEEFLSGAYYDSKNKRLEQIKDLDIPDMVMDILTGIAYIQKPELFTSVTAQLASRLKFDDKRDAIATVAELVAVLCNTDLFDITKESRQASLYIVSRIPLEDSLVDYINHSEYLPPMVCEPLELTHNFSSGYLTHNDSLILGSGNHHDGDLCLDVLNKMNKVALKMDTEFLSKFEEVPTFELDNQDKIDGWNTFKEQSYRFYMLMNQQGNKLYFNHKVDKRGRIYCCGYHLSTQGTAFKKAMLELSNEEIVEGSFE